MVAVRDGEEGDKEDNGKDTLGGDDTVIAVVLLFSTIIIESSDDEVPNDEPCPCSRV